MDSNQLGRFGLLDKVADSVITGGERLEGLDFRSILLGAAGFDDAISQGGKLNLEKPESSKLAKSRQERFEALGLGSKATVAGSELPEPSAIEPKATFTVTTTTDGGSGSLRDAITKANSNSENDTIVLKSGSTYKLTVKGSGEDANKTGDLDILKGTITIKTDGSGPATIDATGLGDRVFDVLKASLALDNVKVTGGYSSYGSGINNYYGTVTVTNSTISGNVALIGGGIVNLAGKVTVDKSNISGNYAYSYGGGIESLAGSVTVSNSTISGNFGGYFGGGIDTYYAKTTVSNSTVSGNVAYYGGGLNNFVYSSATVSNSTISGNLSLLGGGVLNFYSDAQVKNSTVTNNTAYYGGSGLLNLYGTSKVTSTIVAKNYANDDILGSDFTTGGNNLIGNGDGAKGFVNGKNGDKVGTAAKPIDPKLGPLQNNGGPTFTHALLTGSPAIDMGSNPDALKFDQRGSGFNREVPAGKTDIGAFEVQGGTTQPSIKISNGKPNPAVEGTNPTQKFTVTLSAASTSQITVKYATKDGTAIAPDDYKVGSGTLTFAPGETSKTVKITIINDKVKDKNAVESYSVNLSNPTNATINDGTGVGKIQDAQSALVAEVGFKEESFDPVTNFAAAGVSDGSLGAKASFPERGELLAGVMGASRFDEFALKEDISFAAHTGFIPETTPVFG